MPNLTPPVQIIDGKSVFLWNLYYWEEIKRIKHDCGRLLTIYKKYRKIKEELKEIKLGNRICPTCQVGY